MELDRFEFKSQQLHHLNGVWSRGNYLTLLLESLIRNRAMIDLIEVLEGLIEVVLYSADYSGHIYYYSFVSSLLNENCQSDSPVVCHCSDLIKNVIMRRILRILFVILLFMQ